MRPRHAHLVLATLVLTVLAAGCGGSSGGTPRVADLGTTGTTDPSARGAVSGSGPSASADGGGQPIMVGGGGLKFSQCMRAHGVPNFPDPNGQGVTEIGPNSGIDAQSATFQSAAQACRSELRGTAPQLSPAQQAKARREALAFSACMRKHGIPDFPDPSFGTNGNAGIHLAGNSAGDLNPNNPTFRAALQTCQGLIPGVKKGPRSFNPSGPK
jgi:hypothetical protein